MPNIRQPFGQSVVSLPQDARQGLQPVVQNVPMLPPLTRQGQVPVLTQNTLSQNQLSVASQPALQPQTLVSRYTGNLPPQHVAFPGQSGVPPLPPAHPSIRPQKQVVNSLSSNQQMQPSLLQHAAQVGASSLGHSSQTVLPNASAKSSIQSHLSMSDSVSQVPNIMLLCHLMWKYLTLCKLLSVAVIFWMIVMHVFLNCNLDQIL